VRHLFFPFALVQDMNASHDETRDVSGDEADMATAMDDVDVAMDDVDVATATSANGVAVAALQAQVAALRAQVAALRAQVAALQAEVAAPRVQVAALQAEVAARGRVQSASWDTESSTDDDVPQTIPAATFSFSDYCRVLWRPILVGTVFITTTGWSRNGGPYTMEVKCVGATSSDAARNVHARTAGSIYYGPLPVAEPGCSGLWHRPGRRCALAQMALSAQAVASYARE
jgi:hypothetical protein